MTDQGTTSGERWWTVQRGAGPVIATAIHDGNMLRSEVVAAMKLPDLDRLREEDPFTASTILDVPNHVIAHVSRFEYDLNRGPDIAVYETPDQAWGLDVWHALPDPALVRRSLDRHAAYYRMLGHLLDEVAAEHERFVLIDVHSYNHRRDGPDGAPTDPGKAPDVNIGTFSMSREHWAGVVDPLIEAMREFDFNGRRLDVRENIAFEGKGEQTRFVHHRYPMRACAIALEFKKFFMDEWSGEPDPVELGAMRRLIAFTAATARDLLE